MGKREQGTFVINDTSFCLSLVSPPAANCVGMSGHSHSKTKLNPAIDLTSLTKMHSKWITDLNVRHKTIKLKDNIGENLHPLVCDDEFAATTPKAGSKQENADETDLSKTEKSCPTKDIAENEKVATERIYLPNASLDKGLLSKL